MFAICAYGNIRMQTLRAMLHEGLTDQKLPFSRPMSKQSPYEQDFQKFIKSQSIVHANVPTWPTFNRGSFRSNTLPANGPLPIKSGRQLGKGVSAEVFVTQFDTQCRPTLTWAATEDAKDRTLSRALALKVFSDSAQADREQDFVEYLHTQGIQHAHIAESYCGFEYRAKYHLVSELAEMNLEMHMADRKPRHRVCNATWFRSQIIGLVDALKTIHGPTNATTAFHHDIKPANILVSDSTQATLKFTDFGTAGFDNNYTSAAGSHRTHAQGNLYLPPEYRNNQPTSRPHGVWPLGCVLLEFCVWYSDHWAPENPDGLYKFKNDIINAENNDRQGWFVEGPLDRHVSQPGESAVQGPSNHPDFMGTRNGRPLVLVAPTVTKLGGLRQKTGCPNMTLLVDVLFKMLHINPELRITPACALTELDAIPTPWAT